jgi:hypothetical protein
MKKLYGYSLGGSNSSSDAKVYQTSIRSLYQSGDKSQIWYDQQKKKWKTVESSGCAGVAVAMALNALLDANDHTGKSVMDWFVKKGYYYGHGTEHEGLVDYPERLGLNTTKCDNGSKMVEHLKKNRLAVVLLRDRTGEEMFTHGQSDGHYVLVSGYRVKNGVKQVCVNNPLKNRCEGWCDLDDLLANTSFRAGFEPIVIIYK